MRPRLLIPIMNRLWNQVVALEHFVNFVESDVDLLDGVSSHKAEADERVGGSHSGRYNGVDKDSFVEEFVCDEECQVVVANE